MLLPEACHDQMIFDDKIDRGAGVGVRPEAVENGRGDGHPGLGVTLDALALANVMEEQNEIEEKRRRANT